MAIESKLWDAFRVEEMRITEASTDEELRIIINRLTNLRKLALNCELSGQLINALKDLIDKCTNKYFSMQPVDQLYFLHKESHRGRTYNW